MSNLKLFDLERWRAGDKVQYRDGKEVLDMHYFDLPQFNINCPIMAIAWDGSFTSHLPNGSFTHYGQEHPRDIVMAPKKVKYWFASWSEEDPQHASIRHTSNMFTDQSHAKSWKKTTYAKNVIIHEIEIEE